LLKWNLFIFLRKNKSYAGTARAIHAAWKALN
jgi:hypothetical protein